MSTPNHEQLTDDFRDLLNDIKSLPPTDQEKRIWRWFKSLSADDQEFAFRLINISKARDETSIHTGNVIIRGDVYVSKDNIKIDTGGGDVVGSAVGKGAKVKAQIIQSIKDNVATSANIDAKGQSAFTEAIEEVATDSKLDAEEKEAILEELDQLRQQVAKEEPKEGLLKKSWGAIKAIAGTLPKIAALGAWLSEKFPGVLG